MNCSAAVANLLRIEWNASPTKVYEDKAKLFLGDRSQASKVLVVIEGTFGNAGLPALKRRHIP